MSLLSEGVFLGLMKEKSTLILMQEKQVDLRWAPDSARYVAFNLHTIGKQVDAKPCGIKAQGENSQD